MFVIRWTENKHRGEGVLPERPDLAPSRAADARAFHRLWPEYAPTPLWRMAHLARRLGVGEVFVKDESARFGLGAFKVLGASYALGRWSAEHGLPVDPVAARRPAGATAPPWTFVTATDGNHGHGLAWAAARLGHRTLVFVPEDCAVARIRRIESTGAVVHAVPGSYDQAVERAAQVARDSGATLIQDTAWAGYEEIPAWIMQGYLTLAAEAMDQLQAACAEPLTHIFLQAGVGSLAGAVAGYVGRVYGEGGPTLAVVEPEGAAAVFLAATSADGPSVRVPGPLATIMSGLACGQVNPLAWPILRHTVAVFASCPDAVAALGMRVLGNPLADDPRIVAGESGAVTAGFLAAVMAEPGLADLKRVLGLGASSRVLLINTEGATDPAGYRRIVWDGEFPWQRPVRSLPLPGV